MRLLRDRLGQTAISGTVAVLLLIAVAAALVDGLHLLATRQRCTEIASAAALQGTSRGRDYAHYLADGQIALQATVAEAEAAAAANAALIGLGLSGYTIQVEVLEASDGGSIADFPPGQTWTESEPAVGVYLEVPVPTIFLQAITAGHTLDLHVFAAASVGEQ